MSGHVRLTKRADELELELLTKRALTKEQMSWSWSCSAKELWLSLDLFISVKHLQVGPGLPHPGGLAERVAEAPRDAPAFQFHP